MYKPRAMNDLSQLNLNVTWAEVREFAQWSDDRNPIHVDEAIGKKSAFGSNIVHGALSTLKALDIASASPALKNCQPIGNLDIEFRGEIRPSRDYPVEVSDSNDAVTILVRDRNAGHLSIRAQAAQPKAAMGHCDWVDSAKQHGVRNQAAALPANWSTTDFIRDQHVLGTHHFAYHQVSYTSLLTYSQQQVFALCSFIVGMKAPGLSSLFTHLRVQFFDAGDSKEDVAYKYVFKDFDPHFRILQLELHVATFSGQLLAIAEIQSYVRFPVEQPSIEGYAQKLKTGSMAGKIALICGASRGLGAEIAAALGTVGCHVYIACRNPDESTEWLRTAIVEFGGHATVVAGDVGDVAWCEATRKQILESHGRLDVLVLNACAPLKQSNLSEVSIQHASSYISANVGLSLTPLITFLADVNQSQGTVVAISSSAVVELPAGFGDYVAVKMAIEGAVKTASVENPSTRFIIARPGKLRTSWNDTPVRAMGCIPPSAVATQIVKGITGSAEDTFQLLSEFPYEEVETIEITSGPEYPLVLCSTFVLDPIETGLKKLGRAFGNNFQVRLAPYAQILQQLLDPTSDLATNTGTSVVFLRVSDWLRELSEERIKQVDELTDWLRSTVDEHLAAFKNHRTFASGPTIVILCPSSRQEDPTDLGPVLAPEDDLGTRLLSEVIEKLEARIASELKLIPGLSCVVASELHAAYDVPDQIFDPFREELAHIPFVDAYYLFLSALVVRFVYPKTHGPKKVIVLDCDNTLWSGVVGEVGPGGIQFDECHRRLHQKLSQIAESGILVCLCSKNEEHDVWSVFEKRHDFGLKRDQIVASAINWTAKSENIREMAYILNLGLDSFIFIDDNPVECAEVRSGCPSVLTIQWPLESELANRLLDHLWELDVLSTTKEDRKRTQLYKEEFQRQQVKNKSGNFQQFLDSLQLRIDFNPLSEEVLARASQLTLRTNQFNFTTIRRSESELRKIAENSDYYCRTIHVSDRFGDYGLVGLILARIGEDCLEVDTFLLSCRVLGRGVEHQMAADLGRVALDNKKQQVFWKHIPTDRNAPARNLLTKIAGGEVIANSDGVREYYADAETLSHFQLKAEVVDETEVVDDVPKQAEEATTKGSPRERERQIVANINSFATYAQLAKSFGAASADNTNNSVVDDGVEIESVVLTAFAKALRISSDQVKKVDRLDALGCDSLRIVEITVALSKQFNWLPKTLLFEHRKVSEIIAKIASMVAEPSLQANLQTKSATLATTRSTTTKFEVAIVGIGVHCAAGNSVRDLWKLLQAGESAVVPVPTNRPSFVGALLDDRSHFAGLVNDACEFDAEFFGISPREAEYMDPQLRLLLQTTLHALEDAGSVDDLEESTGVFVGSIYPGYAKFANTVGTCTGSVYRCWEGFSLPNRLSQVFGCHGPSLAIDTACSSSATALHYACNSLREGDCEAAIVAGVSLIIDPNQFVQLGRLGILSPSGRCVPFGAGADGTVLGEGVVSLLLRPVETARSRGDRLYAVIKGTGISSGAGSVGFTAPNPNAQAQAARQALRTAGIDPRTVSYIEAHGTGTELGDPIEVRGLELAYGDKSLQTLAPARISHRCVLGSIKPNVGHLEAGAGLMGLVKAALQLHYRKLVPNITADQPNPNIDFGALPFRLHRQLTDWKNEQAEESSRSTQIPLRAGVNSFGVGGSNVHIILEEAGDSQRSSVAVDRPAHLLALSAPNPSSLTQQLSSWSPFLENCDASELGDVCFSNNIGRKKHPIRSAVVVHSEDLQSKVSEAILAEQRQDVDAELLPAITSAFLFSGQGSQYPGMLKNLYNSSPTFKRFFDECCELFNKSLPQRLESIIWAAEKTPEADLIHATGYTQPALFATEYALAQLWKSWGIHPNYLIGHSIGEIAAYCIANGCSLKDAVRLVSARSSLMQNLPAGGAMTAIEAGQQTVIEEITAFGSSVSVAAVNTPLQTILSGESGSLADLTASFLKKGIRCTPLSVSHAFHSILMEPMLDEFKAVLDQLDLGNPQLPIISTANGKFVQEEMSDPQYWVDQVRNPVLYMQAIQTAESKQITHFLEIGPHPVLLGMGKNCIPNCGSQWLPSARKGRDDWQMMLGSLAKLYVDGANIDWTAYDAPYQRKRVQVPGFAFEKRRVWIDELNGWNDGRGYEKAATEVVSNATDAEKVYEIKWQHQEYTTKASRDIQYRWLILSDSAVKNHPLLESLRTNGVSFETHQFNLNLANATENGSFTQLLNQIVEKAKDFDRIVWLDTSAGGADSNADDLQLQASQKVFSIAKLTGLLGVRWQEKKRAFWIVTSNALTIKGSTNSALASSPLWGLAAVATLEFPDHWGGIIDVDQWNQPIASVVREIQSPVDDDQIAIRSGKRYVKRLTLADIETPSRTDPFEFGQGLVLVSGGLGGIGLNLVSWLAEKGARNLVLVSRSGDCSKQAETVLNQLRDKDVKVSIVKADISTIEGIQACRDSIGTDKLAGIFHAAGVDHQQALAATTYDETYKTLQAKVKGAWLLHELATQSHAKHFVCFSSISSVWGSSGRGLYAAANAFLDELCQLRKQQGQPATAINFGPWSGGGMADANSLKELERLGNFGLTPHITLGLVGNLIRGDQAQAVISRVDWNKFLPVVTARRPRPLFDELHQGSHEQVDTGQSNWQRKLATTTDPRAMLVGLVSEEIAKVLRFSSASPFPVDVNLFSIGMDSLTATEVAVRLDANTGLRCRELLLGQPTVENISDQLIVRLGNAMRVDSKSQSQAEDASEWSKSLVATDEVEKQKILEGLLLDELRLAVPAQQRTHISAAMAVAECGLDSLAMVEYASRIKSKLGLSVAPKLAEYKTVRDMASYLAHSIPSASGPQIVGYATQLEDAIFKFCELGWPDRPKGSIAPRWKWMFLDSAKRLGVNPKVWLHKVGDAIAGQMGAQFVKLKIGDVERTTAWFVDTMVLPQYRDQGIGASLLLQSKEDMPFNLSLGQTEAIRRVMEKVGWQTIAPLQTYMLPLNAARVLKSKLPAIATPFAAAWIQMRGSVRRRIGRVNPAHATVRELQCFDARHDELWRRVAGCYDCAAVRDASYLNWKYVDQPNQSFVRLEISIDEQVIACVVLSLYEPEKAYQYRRANIIEMVSATDTATLNTAIAIAVAHAKSRGADAVFMHVINSKIQQALDNFGFLRREPKRYLMVALDSQCDERLLRDPGRWLITQGDSDIDRPS